MTMRRSIGSITCLLLAIVETSRASMLAWHFQRIGAPTLAAIPSRRLNIAMGPWSSPTWKWGDANGGAHDAAQLVRTALSDPQDRVKFLQSAASGESDIEDVKLALALSCQRARNVGYDTRERAWETLMDEIVACAFEGDGSEEKLEQAIRSRLKNQSANYPDATAREMIAVALSHLGFVERGL